MTSHDSDCAVHNEPAYPAGKCDCSLSHTEIPVEIKRTFLATYIAEGGNQVTNAAEAALLAVLPSLTRKARAEGMREAEQIARSMLSDYCVDAFEAILARADAIERGEG